MSKRVQSAHPGRRQNQENMEAAGQRPMSANRTLHDPYKYWENKQNKSAAFFKPARVQTCSHIIKKGDKCIAVQFPLEKTGWKAPTSYQNTKRSVEIVSWAR